MKGDISIGDFMNREVVTLQPEDTMERASMLFEQFSFHHLPVLDKSLRVVGMVSSSDLDRISYGMSLFKMKNKETYNHALYRTLLVKDVMSDHLFVLHPDNTIQDAYLEFKKGRFRAIPIVKDGEFLGIITPLDLVQALLDSQAS